MGNDIWIVLQWWGTLFLVGTVAWPLTKALFRLDPRLRGDDKMGWWDEGYLFSKAVGMAVVTWVVYVMGTVKAVPFSSSAIILALGIIFCLGLVLNFQFSFFNFQFNKNFKFQNELSRKNWISKRSMLILEELFFLAALLFWSWVKAHEPSIRGLEKFMDFGFMQSILNSSYFPPTDMWYAGFSINYYYFGHLVTAVLTKLSGLDLAYTFNLMLATIFALTLTMSFSIGYQLMFICHSREGGNPVKKKDGSPIRSGMTKILAGFLTAFLVTLAGNMQTLYAFTKGYTGENVKPFWELGWKIREIGGVGELWGKIGEGMNTYWYANATRFIPFTIHEFPGYSFVVSDVHGHVLSIPFVLLAIGILIALFGSTGDREKFQISNFKFQIVFYGFLMGVLLMTNALDGPIYFALLGAVLPISNFQFPISKWKKTGETLALVAVVALLTSLPFLWHFKSFVTGLAVNCPPAFLANTKFGPIMFEGVEKCQISPFWMWWLLWGFFVYCGFSLVFRHSGLRAGIQSLLNGSRVKPGMTGEKLLIIFFLFALALVIFPEFFYFKDIYPAHFRSNTMFKLGYQAFILFSIVAGYTIVSLGMSFPRRRESSIMKKHENWIPDRVGDDKIKSHGRIIFFLFLIPQLFLISIFPIFAVRSYFGELKHYEGTYGLNWLAREYSDDFAAIEWLKNQVESEKWKVKSEITERTSDSTLYTPDFTLSVLVEADGDSYTDSARFSSFTGIPTIIGWPVHEWLWRGTYDVVAPRREEVRLVYESEDVEVTKAILLKYSVHYVIVGKLEREKYKSLQEWKFSALLGREVFRSGESVVYETY